MAEEQVNVSKSELQQILEQNKALIEQIKVLSEQNNTLTKNAGSNEPQIVKRVLDRTLRVRRVDGKVVIGFANKGTDSRPLYVYQQTDPNDKNNRLLYVDLILEGSDKPQPVNYNEFLKESEEVTCKIKRIDQQEWVLNQGTVHVKEVDGYSMVELGQVVPVEVMGYTTVFLIELPDGREMKINEAYVNM